MPGITKLQSEFKSLEAKQETLLTLVSAELQGVPYWVTRDPGYRTLSQQPMVGVRDHHGEIVLETLPVRFIDPNNNAVQAPLSSMHAWKKLNTAIKSHVDLITHKKNPFVLKHHTYG